MFPTDFGDRPPISLARSGGYEHAVASLRRSCSPGVSESTLGA